MVFSSTTFLFLFLPLVLILYYNPILKGRKYRNRLLLLSSIMFYAWGGGLFSLLLLFSIFINWLEGIGIVKAKDKGKRLILALALVYDVGLLFIFKYLSFIVKGLDFIVLPIGISFFTFQMISYILDVYWEKAGVQKNFFNLALYISMFPQLIAGPIVRYETIAEEIETRRENRTDFAHGVTRFVYGLGKKTLIANYVAIIADNVFLMGEKSVLMAWLGAICYTLQIYFDFSGYSDMAIGLGEMFGFHFKENFRFPYLAKSITDFWRRWHISLSSWFRDYVYIPLGGNRIGKARWILNMAVVWGLTGIWHGANWTFLVWGLLFFCILVVEKLTGFPEKLKGFSHIYTLLIIILTWVVFRAGSIGEAITYIKCMFGIGTCGIADSLSLHYLSSSKVILIIACILCTPIYQKLLMLIKNRRARAAAEGIVVISVFTLSFIACINSVYNPFIYFRF